MLERWPSVLRDSGLGKVSIMRALGDSGAGAADLGSLGAYE